jgi:hypothetical protein
MRLRCFHPYKFEHTEDNTGDCSYY